MAVNLFTGATNSNWGTATNWSQGTVPTATDGHVTTFDNTSPACTVNGSNRVCQQLDFNGGTGYANTITMTFAITVSGNITLSAAMTIAGAAGLTCPTNGSTFTSNGKAWPNLFTINGTAATYTLADNWDVGTLSCVNGNTLNGNVMYVGSLSMTQALDGTTNIVMNKAGTWSGAGRVGVNFEINSAAAFTISGSVLFGATGKTLLYTASGTVTVAGSTVSVTTHNCTWNTSGMTFNTISFSNNVTITLLSDINCVNLQTITTGNVGFSGAFNVNVSGTWTTTSTTLTSTTTTIVMTGTGNVTGNGNRAIKLVINTAGTITFVGSTVWSAAASITYTAGTVVTTGNTLTIPAAAFTMATPGVVWNAITMNLNGSTLTINGLLEADSISIGVGSITFAGTHGFTTNSLSCTGAGFTITFKAGNTYTVNTSLTFRGTLALRQNINSDTASSDAFLILSPGATQEVTYANAQDINSSGGLTIWSYKPATLTRTTNWNSLVVPVPISAPFCG